MIKQEFETLFSYNPCAKEGNSITQDIMSVLDRTALSFIDEDTFAPEVLDVYKKFVHMKDEAPESMKTQVFSVVRKLAKDCFLNNRLAETAVLYRFLAVKADLIPEDYSFLAEILVQNTPDIAIHLINIFEGKEENEALKYITLGNFYNFRLKNYQKAIYYYENYLKIDNTKPIIYSILGNLYSKVYGDEKQDKQIEYFEKAYEFKPQDRYILHSLAFGYEKLKNFEQANKYYQELLKNNPTSTDYFNYGSFLIHYGQFEKGHEYFTKRFEIDDINFKYPSNIEKKWDFKTDISAKTLLVHYEQGFGDTIMYCRFLPQIKKYAKKVVFVVQNELYTLIKNSKLISDGIEIVPEKDEDDIDYDFNIALLDLPYVVRTTTESIPFKDGYLTVEQKDIEKYANDNNLNNSKKLRIGLAHNGDKNSNYNSRNIDCEKFNILKNNNNELYSVQKDETCAEFIPLGHTFEDFYTSACAIKNMDIIISTDNVILNLAGALGVKTIGLFNFYTNFRWFKIEDNKDVGWYSCVKSLHAEKQNDWDSVLEKLNSILK